MEHSREFKKLFHVTKPGYYFQHISFFFEKIPYDIPKFFPKDHPVWTKGNVLYEYEIETKDIPPFGYEIVEFPEKRSLYLDDNVSTEQYYKEMAKLYASTRYIGFGETELSEVIKTKKLTGILEDSFRFV